LIRLDIKKAFDRISHVIIIQALPAFGVLEVGTHSSIVSFIGLSCNFIQALPAFGVLEVLMQVL
jgi:hypothetical protein